MKEHFHATSDYTSYKEWQEAVTIADELINELFIREAWKQFPDYNVLGEEASSKMNSFWDYTWIIDPLDGTVEYMHWIPLSVIPMALLYNGKPEIGAIYHPFTDEFYYAEKGKGAILKKWDGSDQPIHVSNRAFDEEWSIIGYCLPRKNLYDIRGAIYGKDWIFETCKNIKLRYFGPVARMASHLARGGLDAVLFPSSKPFDLAAAKIIVEEAGGKESDMFGNNQRFDREIKGNILSNGKYHEKLVEIISWEIAKTLDK